MYHPLGTLDYITKAALRKLQWEKFSKTLEHVYHNVAWYRNQMLEKGVQPADIRGLEDMYKLPFTVKTDLRDTYPTGLFAVKQSEIVRLHASSGTTGKPIVCAYTQEDIEIWQEVVVRALLAFGLHSGDILQNSYGYGLFTGGLGLHYGAEALGLTVIPVSGGNSERQIMFLRDFGVTAISCTPSYFIHLLDIAQQMKVDFKELPLKIGVFGAEPWTEGMRQVIQSGSGLKAYDIYGLTEISGPGVGAECVHQNGTHIFEDHFYPEIVDSKTLEPVPDGQEGELVFTTLDKRGMPLIRYRTRDITRLYEDECPCGRTIRRMEKISHRSDDMFIIRGVNVFPGQIESALLAVEGSLPHYQIILTRDHGLDNVEVQVEIDPNLIGDTIRELEQLQSSIHKKIETTIGIRVKVTLMEPNRIPRSEGKAKRVIDKRTI
ncbi:MAG: phenylacetate--CoA ligase [Planctomycetaceae bacterium]|nr:phenylacetate--CoA ligase [Planctomycetaceae bacterium]